MHFKLNRGGRNAKRRNFGKSKEQKSVCWRDGKSKNKKAPALAGAFFPEMQRKWAFLRSLC